MPSFEKSYKAEQLRKDLPNFNNYLDRQFSMHARRRFTDYKSENAIKMLLEEPRFMVSPLIEYLYSNFMRRMAENKFTTDSDGSAFVYKNKIINIKRGVSQWMDYPLTTQINFKSSDEEILNEVFSDFNRSVYLTVHPVDPRKLVKEIPTPILLSHFFSEESRLEPYKRPTDDKLREYKLLERIHWKWNWKKFMEAAKEKPNIYTKLENSFKNSLENLTDSNYTITKGGAIRFWNNLFDEFPEMFDEEEKEFILKWPEDSAGQFAMRIGVAPRVIP